jgi:hypothetical protein
MLKFPVCAVAFSRIALRPAKPPSPLWLRRVKSRNSNLSHFAERGIALKFRVYAVFPSNSTGTD